MSRKSKLQNTREKLAKDRAAIRNLKHWQFHGNTARVPGGRFKQPIDLLIAMERAIALADSQMQRDSLTIRRMAKLKKGTRNAKN